MSKRKSSSDDQKKNSKTLLSSSEERDNGKSEKEDTSYDEEMKHSIDSVLGSGIYVKPKFGASAEITEFIEYQEANTQSDIPKGSTIKPKNETTGGTNDPSKKSQPDNPKNSKIKPKNETAGGTNETPKNTSKFKFVAQSI